MKESDQALLDSVKQMEEEAPSVGLCSYPFKILHDEIEKLIDERDELADFRNPMHPLPYLGYAGQCPRCRVVFLDDSTKFCGNCGQALDWEVKCH